MVYLSQGFQTGLVTRAELTGFVTDGLAALQRLIAEPATYVQLGLVATAVILASLIAGWLRRYLPVLTSPRDGDAASPGPRRRSGRTGSSCRLLAATLLRIAVDISQSTLGSELAGAVGTGPGGGASRFMPSSAMSSRAGPWRRRCCGWACSCSASTTSACSSA